MRSACAPIARRFLAPRRAAPVPSRALYYSPRTRSPTTILRAPDPGPRPGCSSCSAAGGVSCLPRLCSPSLSEGRPLLSPSLAPSDLLVSGHAGCGQPCLPYSFLQRTHHHRHHRPGSREVREASRGLERPRESPRVRLRPPPRRDSRAARLTPRPPDARAPPRRPDPPILLRDPVNVSKSHPRRPTRCGDDCVGAAITPHSIASAVLALRSHAPGSSRASPSRPSGRAHLEASQSPPPFTSPPSPHPAGPPSCNSALLLRSTTTG